MKLPAAILFIFFVSLAACSKKSVPQPESVTINGTVYPVISIGTQSWTAVNYNGPGGLNYNNGGNDPAYGKLYSVDEAMAIILPAGWRLPAQADFMKIAPSVATASVADSTRVYGLMSKTSWRIARGTNTSGFNAVAVGEYLGGNGESDFGSAGQLAIFYSGTFGFALNQISDGYTAPMMLYLGGASADRRVSLRFVKDN